MQETEGFKMTLILTIPPDQKVVGVATDILPSAEAFREAKKIAGKKGHLATVPELIDAQIASSFDSPIWTNWFTSLSEEDYGLNKKGEKLYIVSHGNGALQTPERVEKAIKKGLLQYGFAKLTPHEFLRLQKEGNVIYVDDLRGGKINLPDKYTVISKVDKMIVLPSDYYYLTDLQEDDIFLMRMGSEERRQKFLEKLAQKCEKYGNFHEINDVDYKIPGGRLLTVNSYYDQLSGDDGLSNNWRPVGIAPQMQKSASLK